MPLFRRLFRSLTFRVIAFSSVWAVLALIVIATVISALFRQASERGFESLLSAHLFNLISSVDVSTDGFLTGFPNLSDLRFTEPQSGWYWTVEPVTENLHGELSSPSLTGPVVGVPTSVGYGASFDGLAALLGMLTSCAGGVGVVNIDNGFGAACLASMINQP